MFTFSYQNESIYKKFQVKDEAKRHQFQVFLKVRQILKTRYYLLPTFSSYLVRPKILEHFPKYIFFSQASRDKLPLSIMQTANLFDIRG